jgi:hypothetical protein
MRLQTPAGALLCALLIVGGAACSAIAPAAPPPPPTTIAATAMAEPAPSPTPAASPAGRQGSATPAASTAGGKREIAALWVWQRPEGVTGGASKVRVSVEPNTDQELRVGFVETEVAGSGPMWRSSGWMAVIMSGLLLGVDPTAYRFNYEAGGRLDGPSAGGLVTVATLAAILGHPVRDDATMTGTINPDGTVGPVGGIPHKVDGAAEAKKKLMLIPAGQRRAFDYQRKQQVDVVERGQGLGVEVREVGDIYEAYKLLTGQALPRPEKGRDASLALPEAATERARAKLNEWRARYAKLKEQYAALPAKARPEEITKRLAEADKAAEKAAAAEQRGQLGAAYQQMVSANATVAVAVQLARVLHAYTSGDVPAANTRLRSLKPSMKIDSLLEQIERQTPATLGEVVALANAHGNLSLAMGLTEWGDSLANIPDSRAQQTYFKLAAGTTMYVMAGHMMEVSRDALDLGIGGGGGAPPPSRESVERLADIFRRAAEANLNYFETIVLDEVAQRSGLHGDVVKAVFSYGEPLYLLSGSSVRAMKLMEKRSRQETPSIYATLGGGLNSYVLSSLLVAKYYALDAQFDKVGKLTGVKDEPALSKMLDFAEIRAQEVLGAVADGNTPVQSLVSYQSARVGRDGDVDAKFSALGDYWTATLQGQMLGILSGRTRLVA